VSLWDDVLRSALAKKGRPAPQEVAVGEELELLEADPPEGAA
jgi:plasmid stability protein